MPLLSSPPAIAVWALALGLLITSFAPAYADNWQALRDDPELREGLTYVAVGRRIQRACDQIEVRRAPTYIFFQGLVGRAEDLGFSRREIRAYVDDDAERDRYTEIARGYMAQRGVDFDNATQVCQFGESEISAQTQIGRLLRSN
jgi:hypothetical protein